MTLIVPHRPLTRGHLTSGREPTRQLPDGRWQEGEDNPVSENNYREDIHRGIYFLEKNSVYNHKILVAIDSDVYPQDWWLKEYDNVNILKSNFTLSGNEEGPYPYFRLCEAYIAAIESLPDDEWICYGYTSDLVCSKEWDKHIVQAIEQGGDDKVYVPMFIETRGGGGVECCANIEGAEITAERIWDHWRRHICCHALTYPTPTKGYITEEDFDNYIEIANQAGKGNIIERCGERAYGYYDVMIMKNRYAKSALYYIRGKGFGFDLEFDNALGRAGLLKVVVTKSFVLHPWVPVEWEGEGGSHQDQP